MKLLSALVDDAGMFPPASLAMADAVLRHRLSSSPVLSGHFLCPVARYGELLGALREDDRFEVHLIGRPPLGFVEDARAAVVAVETAAPESWPDAVVPVFVEGVPVRELASTGVFGKLRCGPAVPPVEAIGAFIAEAASHGVPFKATAGLHAAVRGWETTDGVPHHGYLNLLVATARAVTGGDVEEALRCDRGPVLADEARSLSDSVVTATRELFRSYGSCDTDRPVQDAIELGLVA